MVYPIPSFSRSPVYLNRPDSRPGAFLALSLDSEKAAYVASFRNSNSLRNLTVNWLREEALSAFIEMLPYLNPLEKSYLSSVNGIQPQIIACFNILFEKHLTPYSHDETCETLFQLLCNSPGYGCNINDLSHNAYCSFLIARLPDSQKIPFIQSVFARHVFNRRLAFKSLNMALKWPSSPCHRLHLAKAILSCIKPALLNHFLNYTCTNSPNLLFLFLIHLPYDTLKNYLEQNVHECIVKAISCHPLTCFRDFQAILEKITAQKTLNLFINTLSVPFLSEITGETQIPLRALPHELGPSHVSLDSQGYDNFALINRKGIQTLPPVLMGLGALDPHLSTWLMPCSRLFTPDQLRCFFWALPYNTTKNHLNALLSRLDGPSLESALKALPPKLKNLQLDQKLNEVSLIIFSARSDLSTLPSNRASLTKVSEWVMKLSSHLSHPASLPFWKTAENYHPLCSQSTTLKSLLKSFQDKQVQIQGLSEREIDNEPTLKTAPPPFLTRELLSKFGNVDLETVGIRKQSDLDTLGVTLKAVTEFEQIEFTLLDDLPLYASCEWEKAKESYQPVLIKKFFTKHGRVAPDNLENPLTPLKRYLQQPNLSSSWKKLRKNHIYSLSQIEENCLIEEANELFNLEALAAKLS